MKSGLNGRDRW